MLTVLVVPIHGQNINNTLGVGGSFVIKDGLSPSTTFLSLSQADGYLSLSKGIVIPVATTSTVGVIFKGPDRFIHDFQPAGTSGGNTFVGDNAGNFTMGGVANQASNNTAIGAGSMESLTTGYGNTAVGSAALFHATTAFDNCVFGELSLAFNTVGNENSAFGHYALQTDSAGSNCSAFGSGALYYAKGDNNSAFGASAGSFVTTGSDNTLIGYNAQPSSQTVSNEFTLGDFNVATLRCNTTTITALSDARDKTNIRDLQLGLNFLMTVKPRLYNWDRREWYKDGNRNGSRAQKTPTAGFIAQELDAAQTQAHAEWLRLVLKTNPERLEATPGNLLPVMVKAIQELKTENDALKNEIAVLRSSLNKQVKEEVRKAFRANEDSKVSLNERKN
ncbi:MAG TPA: tail fiber domain-containing protein [Bacteroidota bacterium]